VTKTQLQRSHQHIAYERFEKKGGAIAMLPLVNNECATIWTADKETILQLRELSDADFLAALQKTFGYRLGRMQSISQRHFFPLRMVRAEKAVDQSVFLLGNAAHTLHPIAAQGFNLALYEVAVLAELLIEKSEQQKTITTQDLLDVYAQTQKQQSASIGVSHRLSNLFTSSSPFVGLAAQLGMISLDMTAPIKKRFINTMMGRKGSVPRLLLSDTT
jgi:2-octaprenyl-6-methoxyphenol hydroxylase